MLADLVIRMRALFRPNAVEQELDDEVHFHLERLTEKLMAAGLGRDEAERRARLLFGGTDRAKEECRDARGVALVDHTAQDLRYAVRVLRASPAFTIMALISLALGIGATAAVFTVLDAAILRPLPVPHPDRLVVVRALQRNERFVLFNPVFEALRTRQRVLSDMAAIRDEPIPGPTSSAARPTTLSPGQLRLGPVFSSSGCRAGDRTPADRRRRRSGGELRGRHQPSPVDAGVSAVTVGAWAADSRQGHSLRRRWRRTGAVPRSRGRLHDGCVAAAAAAFIGTCWTITAWRFSPA